jgi:hypothetical protein
MVERVLGFTISQHDPRFMGLYAKMVCTNTGQTIAFIVRNPPGVYLLSTEMHEFDSYIYQVYTVWTVDDMEAEFALAFDLIPMVHVEDLAVIMIDPDGDIHYMEYVG